MTVNTASPLLPEDPRLEDFQRILVTGASGFVGRHVAAALAATGRQVEALDRRPPQQSKTVSPSRFWVTDLHCPTELRRALAGIDLVVHIAGNASASLSVIEPGTDFAANAVATVNLAEACCAAGVRRLLYLSSACVYGRPRSVPIAEDHPTEPYLPYGASKLSAEIALLTLGRSSGLDVAIGRAFVLYGPGEDPATAGGEVSRYLRYQLNSRSIPITGDVDRKTRDFLHVTDLARALLYLADRAKAGSTLNLGSGAEYSLRQLLHLIEDSTGRPATWHITDPDRTDSYRLVADTGRLRDLGFAPALGLADGISTLATALGERPALPTAPIILRKATPRLAS